MAAEHYHVIAYDGGAGEILATGDDAGEMVLFAVAYARGMARANGRESTHAEHLERHYPVRTIYAGYAGPAGVASVLVVVERCAADACGFGSREEEGLSACGIS